MPERGGRGTGPGVRMLRVGEGGLAVELGGAVDEGVNARVHALARSVARELRGAILEVVPTYRSLLVYFDPLRVPRRRLEGRIAALVRRLPPGGAAGRSRVVRVPVCYGGEFGPDLEFVARHHGLSPAEVVAVHGSVRYRVYMLGFTPGFPYLGGLPERIATPRLDQPRTRIPAGSVGIAGVQTGIYPVESPGGWRIIGRTPLRLFDPASARPFLLAAGDHLQFAAVAPDEFASLAGRVAAGDYEPDVRVPGEGEAP